MPWELFKLLAISVAYAQQQANCGSPNSFAESFECVLYQIGPAAGIAAQDPLDVILTILRTVLTLVAILGVIGLIFAGAMYMFSVGDESQAKKAKNTIIYVIIGLVIIGLSILAVNLIISAFR